MGTSRTPAEFVGKINRLGQATDRNRRTAVNAGALTTKKAMLAAASAKGVQPGSKIAGRKWGVRYDIRGTEIPTALVRYTGPFHLVNNRTNAHYIAAKGLGGSRSARGSRAFQAAASRFSGESTAGAFGGSRRSKGKRAVVVDGKPYAYVFHPGTSGKAIFPAARAVARQTVPKVMAESMKGVWRKVL